ncbi:hypothetical protein V7056_10685 [Bacillus sp. JJ664]
MKARNKWVATFLGLSLIVSGYLYYSHELKKKEFKKESAEINHLLYDGKYDQAIAKIKSYNLSESNDFEMYVNHKELLDYYKNGNYVLFASRFQTEKVNDTNFLAKLFNDSISEVLKNEQDANTYIYGWFNDQVFNRIELLNTDNYSKVQALLSTGSIEKLIDEALANNTSDERVLEIAEELKSYKGGRRQELDDMIVLTKLSIARDSGDFYKIRDIARDLATYTGQYQEYVEQSLIEIRRDIISKDAAYSEPMPGMTKDEVLRSLWGNPDQVKKGIPEKWVYGSKTIYFEKGIVAKIVE